MPLQSAGHTASRSRIRMSRVQRRRAAHDATHHTAHAVVEDVQVASHGKGISAFTAVHSRPVTESTAPPRPSHACGLTAPWPASRPIHHTRRPSTTPDRAQSRRHASALNSARPSTPPASVRARTLGRQNSGGEWYTSAAACLSLGQGRGADERESGLGWPSPAPRRHPSRAQLIDSTFEGAIVGLAFVSCCLPCSL